MLIVANLSIPFYRWSKNQKIQKPQEDWFNHLFVQFHDFQYTNYFQVVGFTELHLGLIRDTSARSVVEASL